MCGESNWFDQYVSFTTSQHFNLPQNHVTLFNPIKRLVTINSVLKYLHTYNMYIITPNDHISQDMSYFSGPKTSGAVKYWRKTFNNKSNDQKSDYILCEEGKVGLNWFKLIYFTSIAEQVLTTYTKPLSILLPGRLYQCSYLLCGMIMMWTPDGKVNNTSKYCAILCIILRIQ